MPPPTSLGYHSHHGGTGPTAAAVPGLDPYDYGGMLLDHDDDLMLMDDLFDGTMDDFLGT